MYGNPNLSDEQFFQELYRYIEEVSQLKANFNGNIPDENIKNHFEAEVKLYETILQKGSETD